MTKHNFIVTFLSEMDAAPRFLPYAFGNSAFINWVIIMLWVSMGLMVLGMLMDAYGNKKHQGKGIILAFIGLGMLVFSGGLGIYIRNLY